MFKKSFSLVLFICFVFTSRGFAAFDSPQNKKLNLKFSHKYHLKEGVECTSCHTKVTESVTGTEDNLPTMETCFACHDGSTAPNECTTCHFNADKAKDVPRITDYQKIFAHKNHIDRKIECSTCHIGISKVDIATLDNIPTMDSCFACHDNIKAPRRCELCHDDLKTKRPKNHTANWSHEHQNVAKEVRSGPQECSLCHKEDFCQRCHQGDNADRWTHSLNFALNHAISARGREIECQSCHEEVSFCTECHANLGIKPASHSQSNWANFVLGDGGGHKLQARKDMDLCASCHDLEDAEPVCVTCHTDRSGRYSTTGPDRADPRIHAPDFKDKVSQGPWHDDKGYYCFVCHLDTGKPGVGFCGYCHGGEE